MRVYVILGKVEDEPICNGVFDTQEGAQEIVDFEHQHDPLSELHWEAWEVTMAKVQPISITIDDLKQGLLASNISLIDIEETLDKMVIDGLIEAVKEENEERETE
jgi:hypothetical protein